MLPVDVVELVSQRLNRNAESLAELAHLLTRAQIHVPSWCVAVSALGRVLFGDFLGLTHLIGLSRSAHEAILTQPFARPRDRRELFSHLAEYGIESNHSPRIARDVAGRRASQGVLTWFAGRMRRSSSVNARTCAVPAYLLLAAYCLLPMKNPREAHGLPRVSPRST